MSGIKYNPMRLSLNQLEDRTTPANLFGDLGISEPGINSGMSSGDFGLLNPGGNPGWIEFDAGVVAIHGNNSNDDASVYYYDPFTGIPSANYNFLIRVQLTNADGSQFALFPTAIVNRIDFFGNAGADDFVNYTHIDVIAEGGSGNDSLVGGSGDDDLRGRDGNDTLVGGFGNDSLYGGDWGDDLYGNHGNDVLAGNAGSDELYGMDGYDTLSGGTHNDTLDGGNHNDYLSGDGSSDDIFGGNGNDRAYGGSGYDDIFGQNGNDSLYGGTGNDLITGQAGNDFVYGEANNDTVYGYTGNDLVSGGDGDDSVSGWSGDDDLFGGEGEDTLWGHDGEDYLNAGEDDDFLYGGNHDDILHGLFGDDYITGQAGNDYITGGGDDDTLYGYTGNDTILGQSGNDFMSGWSGDDSMEGNQGNDEMFGHSGDDTLYGGDGNDTLDGGSGLDGVFGGFGFNQVTGGSGADRFLTLDPNGNDQTMFDLTSDTLSDVAGEDAVITFLNRSAGPVNVVGLPTAQIGAGSWSQSEVETIDEALANLHQRVGSTVLLETASGGALTFFRAGAQLTDLPNNFQIGGWNAGGGNIAFTDNGMVNDDVIYQVTYHEIAHNFDDPIENSIIPGFRNLSGWQSSAPDNGFWWIPAGDGSSWVYSGFSNAGFARDYGRWNPFEDFATSFAAVMMDDHGLDYLGNPAGVNDIPLKANMINDWFDSL